MVLHVTSASLHGIHFAPGEHTGGFPPDAPRLRQADRTNTRPLPFSKFPRVCRRLTIAHAYRFGGAASRTTAPSVGLRIRTAKRETRSISFVFSEV